MLAELVALAWSVALVAMSLPPEKVISCVCFVVAGLLAAFDAKEKWWRVLVAAGLAVGFWPW